MKLQHGDVSPWVAISRVLLYVPDWFFSQFLSLSCLHSASSCWTCTFLLLLIPVYVAQVFLSHQWEMTYLTARTDSSTPALAPNMQYKCKTFIHRLRYLMRIKLLWPIHHRVILRHSLLPLLILRRVNQNRGLNPGSIFLARKAWETWGIVVCTLAPCLSLLCQDAGSCFLDVMHRQITAK